jgi:hypothetical protein
VTVPSAPTSDSGACVPALPTLAEDETRGLSQLAGALLLPRDSASALRTRRGGLSAAILSRGRYVSGQGLATSVLGSVRQAA